MSDKIGSLDVGKFADALVVEKDPLMDVTALRSVRYVIKEGKLVFRANHEDKNLKTDTYGRGM